MKCAAAVMRTRLMFSVEVSAGEASRGLVRPSTPGAT